MAAALQPDHAVDAHLHPLNPKHGLPSLSLLYTMLGRSPSHKYSIKRFRGSLNRSSSVQKLYRYYKLKIQKVKQILSYFERG